MTEFDDLITDDFAFRKFIPKGGRFGVILEVMGALHVFHFDEGLQFPDNYPDDETAGDLVLRTPMNAFPRKIARITISLAMGGAIVPPGIDDESAIKQFQLLDTGTDSQV